MIAAMARSRKPTAGHDQKMEAIESVPIFAGLSAKERARVARLIDEVDVPAGRRLIKEGDRGGEFFIIVSGAVEVRRKGRLLRRLAKGDFVGEIALIDKGPRTATVTTTEPSTLFVVASREFHSLMNTTPGVESKVLRALAYRVRNLDAGANI
jgi:CRP/FNR family cyclic AMP-dependent transcriptional regulator